MDLERIKQQFRIRSGRNKKLKQSSRPPTQKNQSRNQSTSPQQNGDHHDQTDVSGLSGQHSSSEVNGHTEDLSNGDHPSTGTNGDTSPDHEAQLNPQDHELVEAVDDTQQLDNGSPEQADDTEKREEDNSIQESSTPELSKDNDKDDTNNMPADKNSIAATESDAGDFDLNPPSLKAKSTSLENVCDQLWSEGHLNYILHDTRQLARFAAFLTKYHPRDYPMLQQYVEAQKAIKAVEYANAVASGLRSKTNDQKDAAEQVSTQAAQLDPSFTEVRNSAFSFLINSALPMFVTANLVKVISECLTNEITGRSTPAMRNLIGGLSEVFCLTDPNQEDNPIIYASEEFYRYTGYGQDDVIGYNCRFLQGRGTNPESPKRLKEAIKNGKELCETLLNYRRDGRPFINMLMIAPLHDSRGKVKYHIGAQVDVSGVLEQGRAIESFPRYLQKKAADEKRHEAEKAQQQLNDESSRKKRALARLRDLSEMFDLEESAIVQASSRSNSRTRGDDEISNVSTEKPRGLRRRRLDEDDDSTVDEDNAQEEFKDGKDWKLGEQSGEGRLSGTLPGIYETFMLVRPAPSLRIVFVSPKLRKIGNVIQSPFLSHVAGPSATLEGLQESLKIGVPVSARIHFMPERGQRREGTRLRGGTKHDDGKHGHAVWISCTPLLGADDRIGVWMIIFVQKSKIEGYGNRNQLSQTDSRPQTADSLKQRTGDEQRSGKPTSIEIPKSRDTNDMPIKPVRISSQTILTGKVEHEPEMTSRAEDAPAEESSRNQDEDKSSEHNIPLQDMDGHADHEQPHSEPQERPDESVLVNSDEATQHSEQDIDHNQDHVSEEDTSEGYVNTRSPRQSDDVANRLVITGSDSEVDEKEKDEEHEADTGELTPQGGTSDQKGQSSPLEPFSDFSSPSTPTRTRDNDVDRITEQQNYVDDSPEETRENDQEPNLQQSEEQVGDDSTILTANPDKTDAISEKSSSHGRPNLDEDTENQADDEDDDSAEEDKIHGPTSQIQSSLNMDYLRHPGSHRFRDQNAHDDKFSDLECATSPYSVD